MSDAPERKGRSCQSGSGRVRQWQSGCLQIQDPGRCKEASTIDVILVVRRITLK